MLKYNILILDSTGSTASEVFHFAVEFSRLRWLKEFITVMKFEGIPTSSLKPFVYFIPSQYISKHPL
jgi:hypothetical protein